MDRDQPRLPEVAGDQGRDPGCVERLEHGEADMGRVCRQQPAAHLDPTPPGRLEPGVGVELVVVAVGAALARLHPLALRVGLVDQLRQRQRLRARDQLAHERATVAKNGRSHQAGRQVRRRAAR